MSMIQSNVIPKLPSGYNIEQSLRFDAPSSSYLSRTPSVAGNRKTWTFSTWVKRGNIGQTSFFINAKSDSNNYTTIGFNSSNQLDFIEVHSGSVGARKITTQLFRDVGAYYYLEFVWDTTNATASDRMRIYVNGERVTSFSTSTDPAINYLSYFNNNVEHRLGYANSGINNFYFDGYLAETYFIDGQALTPDNFGEFDETYGHWKPKKYEGTYGTNGFYLPFDDAGFIGKDKSTTLGDELITNGTFDTDISGWTYWEGNDNPDDAVWEDGRIKITATTSGYEGVYQTINCNIGSDYVITYSGDIGTSNGIGVALFDTSNNSLGLSDYRTSSGDYVFKFTAPVSNIKVRITNYQTAGYVYFDNISAREIVTQGNDFTATNLSATDIVLDSPTNNFATWNILDALKTGASFQEGNLKYLSSSANGRYTATIDMSAGGKYYAEFLVAGSFIGTNNIRIHKENDISIASYGSDGSTYGITGSPTFSAWSSGDIIGFCLDIDNSTITFYKNGILQGSGSYTSTISSNFLLEKSILFCMFTSLNASTQVTANFGQDSSFAGNKTPQGYTDANGIGDFYYPVPSGYFALCTNNLEAIPRPYEVYVSPSTENDYFEGTYVGNGSTDGTFIYLGFLATDIVINGTHYDQTNTLFDFNANGIKCRSTTQNANGVTYTIEAWVDVDFKFSNAQ